jgi:hypothetical protein
MLPKPTMEEAAMIDTTTTVIALAQGATELNPLGLVGTTAGKAFALGYKDTLPPEEGKKVERITSSLWTGAGVNNIVQILIAPPFVWSAGIGILVGIVLYYQ